MSDSTRKFVSVMWSDAFASRATDAYTAEEVPHGVFQVETRGWLLKEDATGVSLACETYYNDAEKQWEYRGHTFVPAQMVISVTPIPQPRKRKTLVT